MVPNFIDAKKEKNQFTDCQRELMAEDDEKIVTHISNFRKVKRIDDVVKIFFNIQKEIKSKLIMVGEGPEVQPAKRLADELGISDKIMFLGESNDIDKILCFSDLFLLPSEKESFGLAALEAMVNGVPVISSNTGGLPEVNKEGFSGYLSKVGDVEGMAKNAIHILSDDKRLKKFKLNAKEMALKFDTDSIIPQYEEIYIKAASNLNAKTQG